MCLFAIVITIRFLSELFFVRLFSKRALIPDGLQFLSYPISLWVGLCFFILIYVDFLRFFTGCHFCSPGAYFCTILPNQVRAPFYCPNSQPLRIFFWLLLAA